MVDLCLYRIATVMWLYRIFRRHNGHALKPRQARERYLLPPEWRRLHAVLEAQRPSVRVYFYLLMLEGPRMSEARAAQWAHLDLEEGIWYKPKTKPGRSHTLALSRRSCELLDSLPRDGRYVFHGTIGHTGSQPEQPWSRTAVHYHWAKIRAEAGLADVQIRDLRRSTASWLAMMGESTLTIQKVLGHSGLRLIHVYAKLDQTAVRAALDRLAERVLPKGDEVW